MIKYLIVFFIVLKSLIGEGQGIPQVFVHKDGEKIGRWLVRDIPNNIIPCCGTNQGQYLIFFPPAYFQGKLCGVGIWQGGKLENTNLDVTQVYSNSLPLMIQNGLTPYSILPNKDTLWHVLVAIHNNFQSSYRTKLPPILNYIFDSIVKKYNANYVWASGLSEGGTGTWGIFMIDSAMSKRFNFCIPMATGGYDDSFTALQYNLLVSIYRKVYFLPYLGTQDPGWLPFQTYDAFLKNNAPGQYFPRFITNGTHSANVWDVPWKSRGFWDTLGMLNYKIPIIPTDIPVHAKILQDSQIINYPNTVSYLFDSSYSGSGKLLNTQWFIQSAPNGLSPLLYKQGSGALWLSRLIPGVYKIGLRAFDSATNYIDTAYAYIKVNGPVIPPCPTCPPPRKCIGFTIDAITGKFLFTYDDGNP